MYVNVGEGRRIRLEKGSKLVGNVDLVLSKKVLILFWPPLFKIYIWFIYAAHIICVHIIKYIILINCNKYSYKIKNKFINSKNLWWEEWLIGYLTKYDYSRYYNRNIKHVII